MFNAVLNERVRKVWKLIVATEAVTQALAMIPVSQEEKIHDHRSIDHHVLT
jgi:hypothetical protein